MFFLGLSAHMFIYLLVPAFLIVCLYFRGTGGNPEAISLLPESIAYEHRIMSGIEQNHTYIVRKWKRESDKKTDCIPEFSEKSDFFPPSSEVYSLYNPSSVGLRAPPAMMA